LDLRVNWIELEKDKTITPVSNIKTASALLKAHS
jgi:hypothetical protein